MVSASQWYFQAFITVPERFGVEPYRYADGQVIFEALFFEAELNME